MAQTPESSAPAKTNSLAIAALILSFFIPVVGIILGIVALNQIKETHEGGHGMAVAAIVISIAWVVIAIGIFMMVFFVFGTVTSQIIQSNGVLNQVFNNLPLNSSGNFNFNIQ